MRKIAAIVAQDFVAKCWETVRISVDFDAIIPVDRILGSNGLGRIAGYRNLMREQLAEDNRWRR